MIPIERIKNGVSNIYKDKKVKRILPLDNDFGLPKEHISLGAFGTITQGKTVAIGTLAAAYQKAGKLNYLYGLSPNIKSMTNTSLDRVKFTDVFSDRRNGEADLERVKELCGEHITEYEEEEAYKKIYAKYLIEKREHIMVLGRFEQEILARRDYQKPRNLPYPSCGVFIDDMTHTPLMINSPNSVLSNFCLQHRHYMGHGITVMQAFQTYKAGMPKVARSNLTMVLLFGPPAEDDLKSIHKEICGMIPFKTFQQLVYQACQEPHDFLLIDKKIKDKSRMFGRNFEDRFVLNLDEEKRKVLEIAGAAVTKSKRKVLQITNDTDKKSKRGREEVVHNISEKKSRYA